ncbi:52 kDa repressor of the inhibitor of the protein kinase-like [Corticium candelabrum]|uniref:52 kDa repressor of the inhibitor of the protein kinase-like n=1 Tax=Corticium candelabrum TaxID=121492 RepID=UPI002E26633F|nr:52 kDa repressor of the inhibitor of the protein kinase-like [Corticium candelabrum]
MALVVAHACFGFVKGLTVSLQGRSQDICSAYVEVDSVKTALYEVRVDIHTFHKKLYATAVGLAETINASLPSIPRRCARQSFRSNVPALISEDYYRRDLTVPFLDEMIAHINSHFSEIQKNATMALSLVPSVLMSPEQEQSTTDLAHHLAEFYADDLPNPSTLQQELHVWKCKWKSFSAERPSSLSKSLFHANDFKHPPIVANCLYLASHQL